MIPPSPKSPAAYEPLRPIMERHGATCSPGDFHWHVSQAFHSAEAAVYDRVHAGMFEGSDPMWRRLVRALPERGGLSVLDVGAGTGLVGEHLARIAGTRIASMTLLDPNERMLERSRERSRGWPFPVELVQGDLDAVAGRAFDAVTASSVLHHVVELEAFCGKIAALVRPEGVFLQMQDPRAGSRDDDVLARRRLESRPRRRRSRRSARERLKRLGERIARPFVGARPNQLQAGTNAALLEAGVISRPMDLETIWAVTDFHVPGQPGDLGQGIGLADLTRWLDGLDRVDEFTYEFHGVAWDLLSDEDRARELSWFAQGDPHGMQFGSAWRARG